MIFASFTKTSIDSNELHFILGTKCYQPFHSYVPFMICICNKYLLQEEKNFFEQWKLEISHLTEWPLNLYFSDGQSHVLISKRRILQLAFKRQPGEYSPLFYPCWSCYMLHWPNKCSLSLCFNHGWIIFWT